MGDDIQQIKINAAKAVKEIYGRDVLDVQVYDDGSVKVTTSGGDFLIPKSGGYVVKED